MDSFVELFSLPNIPQACVLKDSEEHILLVKWFWDVMSHAKIATQLDSPASHSNSIGFALFVGLKKKSHKGMSWHISHITN